MREEKMKLPGRQGKSLQSPQPSVGGPYLINSIASGRCVSPSSLKQKPEATAQWAEHPLPSRAAGSYKALERGQPYGVPWEWLL